MAVTDDTDRIYTEAEAAERLNLPQTWIATERRAGRIPHQKFGRHIRYTDEHIAAILKRHEVQAASDPAGLTPRSRAYHEGRIKPSRRIPR